MDDGTSHFCLPGENIVMTIDKDTNQGKDPNTRKDPGQSKEMTQGKDSAQVTQLISAKDIAEYLRKNPEYANTLSRVATEGIDAFYSGEIAAAIATAAQEPPNGGTLTTQDIAAYRPVKRSAICGDFRDVDICTTPPPSSGAAQIMIGGLYEYLAA